MTTFLKNTFSFLLIVTIVGSIISCSNSKDSKESSTQATNKAVEANKIFEKEFKYPIPTSYQLTQLLKEAGAAFVLAITNPVEKCGQV